MKTWHSMTLLVSCAALTHSSHARISPSAAAQSLSRQKKFSPYTHDTSRPSTRTQKTAFSSEMTHPITRISPDVPSLKTRTNTSPSRPSPFAKPHKTLAYTHPIPAPISNSQLTPQQQTIAQRIAIGQTNIVPAAPKNPDARILPSNVSVHAAVAVADLLDKITILEIKLERITDQEKLKNIRAEYDVLQAMYVAHVPQSPELEKLKSELITINKRLWDLEDAVRAKENSKTFDADFIRLARTIYLSNDERGLIKRDINALVGSHIIEEKSYGEYRTDSEASKRSWDKKAQMPAAQSANTVTVTVEMAVGELFDKITVLEIKQENITNPDKLKNIKTELAILYETVAKHVAQTPELTALVDTLREHNKKMWGIQIQIREKERLQQFDDSFIQLARGVYCTNDARCGVKREINMLLGSRLIEEKKYTEYKA